MNQNSVVHFEVPFDDKERAMKFYAEVFGWQMQDMPEMQYVIARTTETDDKQMIKNPGAINGGMYKRGGGSSVHPVLVLDVPSIDNHIPKVTEAGGSVVKEKVSVGGMGFYAQVKDTEGNIIGLWETVPQKS